MLKKTFRYGRLIFGTLFAVVLAYILYQVINAFGSSIKTVRASIETAGISVSGTALLVRNEVILPPISAESYSLILSDGEKIAAGGTYARVYASGSALASYQEDQTNRKVAQRLASIAASLDDQYDIADLNRSITTALTSLPAAGESAEGASSIKNTLSVLLCKRRYAMDTGANLSNTLNYYTMLTSNYDAGASAGSPLVADVSGYYSSYSDGYESSLSPESTADLTVEYVRYCIEHQTDFASELTASPGKIVTDFHWKFLLPADKDQAALLKENTRYQVDMQGERISAKLLCIRGDDNSGYLLEFSSDANISHFSSLRTSLVTVIVEEYTGYRVPLDALRVIDGQTGVFCLQGYVAKFVEVDVLWKGDTYYIVEADFKSQDGLFTNDYIIINTKGLTDGKVVTNDPISN